MPISVALFVEVKAGRIHPQISTEQLQNLVKSLPFDDPMVEKIEIRQDSRSSTRALVTVSVKGGYASQTWPWVPGEKFEIRSQLTQLTIPQGLLEQEPLYQALLAQQGQPTSGQIDPERPNSSGYIEIYFRSSLQLRYEIVGGKLTLEKFKGPLSKLQVAELARPLKDIVQQLGMTEKDLKMALINSRESESKQGEFIVSVYDEGSPVAPQGKNWGEFAFLANGTARKFR
ncbi:hypothetical protein EON80_32925 [bacterium]|nr:MAG: hypothetical protein EON80_32925 [bacterium]